MKRIYHNTEHQPVRFFIGQEVENSPMRGRTTLFVVGIQPVSEIVDLAVQHNIQHIYLGANQSFESYNEGDDQEWCQMIAPLLLDDYHCTLDLDVRFWPRVQAFPFHHSSRFIPMISVKMPYAEFANPNTTIKIDDTGFDATNSGVWCHDLKGLLTKGEQYTAWNRYSKDTII
jgi:hypothetical protein